MYDGGLVLVELVDLELLQLLGQDVFVELLRFEDDVLALCALLVDDDESGAQTSAMAPGAMVGSSWTAQLSCSRNPSTIY
eukprot:2079863-Amphidinium_carterae.1